LNLSLVYFTYRPGGMDMLANSLEKQTYERYELIIIDDLPNRNLTDYFEDKNIPLAYYGPSKKKCYPDTPFNQINAINTGLLQAAGNVAILIEDYAWLRPKTLERWNQICKIKGPKTMIAGVGEYWGYKPPENIGDITVWNEEFKGDFSKCEPMGTWRPEVFEYFYSAMPMPALEYMNAMDERLDYWNQWPALMWPEMCKWVGINFYTDDENKVDLIDHRRWNQGDEKWWWINRTYTGGMVKQPKDFSWDIPAPNCFNLAEDRPRIL